MDFLEFLFHYKISVDIYTRAIKNNEYEKYFFPVFSDNSFLINLDNTSNNFGQIFIFSPSLVIIEPISYYDSLKSAFCTILTCIKEKAFWYDNDGFFEYDPNLRKEITKKLNPNSDYWK